MNTINKSTSFSPFQPQMGHSTCVIPLLMGTDIVDHFLGHAHKLIKNIEIICMEAQDNLLRAKISQSAQVNKTHSLTFPFAIEGHVDLLIHLELLT